MSFRCEGHSTNSYCYFWWRFLCMLFTCVQTSYHWNNLLGTNNHHHHCHIRCDDYVHRSIVSWSINKLYFTGCCSCWFFSSSNTFSIFLLKMCMYGLSWVTVLQWTIYACWARWFKYQIFLLTNSRSWSLIFTLQHPWCAKHSNNNSATLAAVSSGIGLPSGHFENRHETIMMYLFNFSVSRRDQLNQPQLCATHQPL